MSTIQMTDKIDLTDAPSIPGLSFRAFRGEEDYPHMLAVIEGSKDVDGVERSDTLEKIANIYNHLTNCNPARDILMAEIEGQMVGYNRCFWEQEQDGKRIYTTFGFLLPAWRRKGIGSAMLHFSETRLRQIAAEHPQDGPRFFQSWAQQTEKGTIALLEREGYQAARWNFEMRRDLSEPFPAAPMPDGLEVRPVRPEDIRAVWEAANEAFRDHWGYVPPEEEQFQEWQESPTFDPSLWKVAWDGDQVAGMVQNYLDRDENLEYERQRGHTEGICVRRPWRKRGLARSLIVQSMQMFKAMGMTETALGVDTQNLSGALKLYQSVGYRQTKTFIVYRKPME